ncbi:type II toxin-antitoxin system mRNA interferase toxin, RelE/StbE family [Candidatus Parcubacteria bacterium]|nr:type II toxin-antitoxin system mRNA interferase toxin, RelE/StbE family [Candidatus Parcubacteria bacterium]
MIILVYSNYFLKSARKLPKIQQNKLAELLEKFQKNPFSSELHTKSLTGKLAGFYSFRITRDWRVIFQFLSSEKIQLIDIGHRKDIYK